MDSYNEFKSKNVISKGKCFCCHKDNVDLFLYGDERFYCAACEECSDIKSDYNEYVKQERKREKCKKLLDEYFNKIAEAKDNEF